MHKVKTHTKGSIRAFLFMVACCFIANVIYGVLVNYYQENYTRCLTLPNSICKVYDEGAKP